MTNRNPGRWLLVVLAIAGLGLAAPVVSAHGDEPTEGNETVTDGEAVDRAAWMGGHMTDHMGPDAVDEMESRMGVTVDETAQEMADDDHTPEMNGRGHGC